MTGDIMKSTGQLDPNRMKIEGRQSINRRKMSKNSPIVNGAEEKVGYTEEETMLRQVNLAAAYHDHISCTKSAEICKIPDNREGRVNLPCETDHIYANCSETKTKGHNMVSSAPSSIKDKNDEKRQLQEMCLLQLDLIKQLEEQNAIKERQIQALKQENELLKVRQERMERRMCLLKRNFTKSDNESDNVSDVGSALSDNANPPSSVTPTVNAKTNATPVHLVTRYFGRRSKTIPLRALKRRYLGPPKSFPSKKSAVKYSSSTASMSSASETHDEEKTVKSETVNSVKLPIAASGSSVDSYRKHHKKRGRRPKALIRIEDCLTTDKEYYLPDLYSLPSSLDNTETIDVPSWRFKPVTSFYQMEGTENIDDRVFHRRHLKCEQDERRRKRWDIQRLREQKANEKHKNKQNESMDNPDGQYCRKADSFFPNPNNIEFIEITETLPVLAFGHPIPLFQPSEFSLPWKVGENRETPEKVKKNRTTPGNSKIT